MNLKRKEQILKCIVEEFIKTAEPVGSENLLKNYNLNCSSATIRNGMAQLETEGMLEKTHVSSGRVPSAKGYQYYIDHIGEKNLTDSVDMTFQREFQRIMQSKTQSVEEVLAKSCEMLSDMTKMATVVLGPKADEEHLVSIQLLKLSDTSAMGIFITDSGYVEKKTFVVPKDSNITFEQMINAVSLLNDRLKGSKISELQIKTKSLAPIVVKLYGKEGSVVIEAFLETMLNFAQKRFSVYGQKNLLNLPEYKENKEAFLNAVDALENPDLIEHDFASRDDLGSVKVGFTNDKLGDLAVVSKAISGKDQIAIIGPKRMDYKKILSALEYVVYMIDRYINSSSNNNTALVPVSTATEIKTDKKKTITAKKKVRKGGLK
jgi:heat-inducible transcriptional repressor